MSQLGQLIKVIDSIDSLCRVMSQLAIPTPQLGQQYEDETGN